jgi:GT2 family glycosyltransferase
MHEFAVVGVAGNSRRLPGQLGWVFLGVTATEFVSDDFDYLRGGIAHGPEPCGYVNRFGPTYAECELLDGVFMAARRDTLLEHGLFFDPRFKFHFYDLDFCRTARAKDLRVGVWPISLTHQSHGSFGSPSWTEAYHAYLEKWKD